MRDGGRRTTDDEIERLLWEAPRRTPSPELWERVSAEACRAAQRPRWRGLAVPVAVAAAVVALAAGLLLTRGTPTASYQPVQTAQVRAPVGAAPHPVAQPPTQVAHVALVVPVSTTRRHEARPKVIAPTPEVVVPAPVQEAVPPPPPSPPPAAEQAAAPTAPDPPPAEPAESSYYIAVSRGDTTSVLEGSVTERSSDHGKEIRIAYDATTPGPGGSN
jgi:hypothetical protein